MVSTASMVWPSLIRKTSIWVSAVKSTRSCSMAKRFIVHTNATLPIMKNGAHSNITSRGTMVLQPQKAPLFSDPASAAWTATQASAPQSSVLRTSLKAQPKSNFCSDSPCAIQTIAVTIEPCVGTVAWLKRKNGVKLPTGTSKSTIGHM